MTHILNLINSRYLQTSDLWYRLARRFSFRKWSWKRILHPHRVKLYPKNVITILTQYSAQLMEPYLSIIYSNCFTRLELTYHKKNSINFPITLKLNRLASNLPIILKTVIQQLIYIENLLTTFYMTVKLVVSPISTLPNSVIR